MPNAFVIFNPKSGSRFHRVRPEQVKRALDESGIQYDWSEASTFDGILLSAKGAVERDYETVIVCGGDGTVRAAASALQGTSARLGILPIGTANLFARDIEIPLNLSSAAALIAENHVRSIDMGLVGDQPFVMMCGIGLDAKAVRYVIPRMKHWLGWWGYLYSGLLNFFTHRPFQARLYIDSHDRSPLIVRTPLVIIGNARAYGLESFRITHLAEIDDGLLDVCILPSQSLYDLIKHSIGVVFKKHFHDERILYFRTRRLLLETIPDVPVQLDGDWETETPISVDIKPRSLNLITPKTT